MDDTGGEGIALNMAAYIDVLEGNYQRAIDLMEPILERILEREAGYASSLRGPVAGLGRDGKPATPRRRWLGWRA